MTQTEPSRGPFASNTTIALVIYILYIVGYFVGLTWIAGVIMAHVQSGSGDPMLETHYQFQIRTFWIGLLYLVVGTVLIFVLVGFLVYAWWFIWSLIRNIKGLMFLNENRPIPNPTSWLFG
jgi:uncharacterized membrane protein